MLVVAALLIQGCGSEQHLFSNGDIYTADPGNPWVEAVVVEDDRIVYAGSMNGATAVLDQDTIEHDLQGRLLLPGFIDSHAHVFLAGIMAGYESLSGSKSHADVIARLKQAVSNNTDEWIFVSGLDIGLYADNIDLKREELDAIELDRPTVVFTSDMHSMWLNSAALKRYNITKDTPEKPGAVIRRDSAGNPTGMIADKAVREVAAQIPFPKLEVAKNVLAELNTMTSLGYTGFMEAFTTDESIGFVYRTMDLMGLLDLRAVLAVGYESGFGTEQFLAHIRGFEKYENARIKADTIKIFIDGATTPEIYNDTPPRGSTTFPQGLIDEEELSEVVAFAAQHDYSIYMHAIGNESVRMGLDAIEQAKEEFPASKSRFSITHMMFSRPESPAESPARFLKLDVFADFQPGHAGPGWTFNKMLRSTMRDEMIEQFFMFRDYKDAGVNVVTSTDYPTQSNNPFYSIETGVTRDDALVDSGVETNTDQTLSVKDWVDGFTRFAAMQLGIEDETGSISVGKKADLIIVNQNIFEVDPKNISDSSIDMTMFGGEVVYSR